VAPCGKSSANLDVGDCFPRYSGVALAEHNIIPRDF
jgi:hypothetical protein